MRRRVKRDIYASPLDFQRRHPDFAEEQKGEEQEMQVDPRPNLGYVPADGGPNVIGNVEDEPVLPDKAQADQSGELPMYPDGGGDQMMFTPIAPVRTEAQMARMASRRAKSKERPPQQ